MTLMPKGDNKNDEQMVVNKNISIYSSFIYKHFYYPCLRLVVVLTI